MVDFITSSSVATFEYDRENLSQFLSFQLGENAQAMLPVTSLSEVFELSSHQVIPIPDMPAWVLGIFNQRGDILWIVDLANLLGLTPTYQQEIPSPYYPTLSIQVGSTSLGLTVDRVNDMEWCDPSQIESVPADSRVGDKLAPVLKGYVLTDGSEDMFMVLDGEAILKYAFQEASMLNLSLSS